MSAARKLEQSQLCVCAIHSLNELPAKQMRVLLLLAVGVSGLPPPDGNAYAEATPRALTFATVPHVAAEAPVLPGRMTYSGSTTSGADSWVADWGASPSERCQVWSTNSAWGALVNGQTLQQACQSDWAKWACWGTCSGPQAAFSGKTTSGNFALSSGG